MTPRPLITLVFAGAFLLLAVSASSEPIYYPSKGQTDDQLNKDKFECYGWASGETGFDPAAAPPSADNSEADRANKARRGSAVRGAAGGAAVGAVGGAIAGDAGKGAAIGAGVGAVGNRMRANRNAREAKADANAGADAAMAAYNDQRETWQRAVNACMSGRGYSVN